MFYIRQLIEYCVGGLRNRKDTISGIAFLRVPVVSLYVAAAFWVEKDEYEYA